MDAIAFDDEQLAESRRLNATIEEFLAKAPSVHTIDPAVTRAQRAAGGGVFGPPVELDAGETRTIADGLQVRMLRPSAGTVDGVYLHIHGGGWTLGSAFAQDVALQRTADETGAVVVSVDYRLAPEHPFPAGPDDCEAAACWLLDHAASEFGTSRLAIGGESAGAHLAALTLLRLRDRHGAAGAFVAANLVYGAYDLSMTPSVRRWGDRNLILSGPIMAWFYDCFLPDRSPEERRDPEVSPLYADLAGLPPALFSVGALDPLIDDNLFLAARWRAAGNESTLHVYPESLHAFNGFPTAIAEACNATQHAFLQTVLGGSTNI